MSFDNIGSGLMVGEKKGLEPTKELKDGKLKWFAVAGEDKVWHIADAVIDGDKVVVSSQKVQKSDCRPLRLRDEPGWGKPLQQGRTARLPVPHRQLAKLANLRMRPA